MRSEQSRRAVYRPQGERAKVQNAQRHVGETPRRSKPVHPGLLAQAPERGSTWAVSVRCFNSRCRCKSSHRRKCRCWRIRSRCSQRVFSFCGAVIARSRRTRRSRWAQTLSSSFAVGWPPVADTQPSGAEVRDARTLAWCAVRLCDVVQSTTVVDGKYLRHLNSRLLSSTRKLVRSLRKTRAHAQTSNGALSHPSVIAISCRYM